MKLAITMTAALFGGVVLPVAAFAGPFGLPDNEIDGYRGTGCDPAQQVQIYNDAGKYLYSNNPTCTVRGNGSSWPKPVEDDEDDEGEEPGDDDVEGPGDDVAAGNPCGGNCGIGKGNGGGNGTSNEGNGVGPQA